MATYQIDAPAMMEIQIVGRLHGQRTRNVFHYLYPSGAPALADGKTAAENALGDFQTNMVDGLLPLLSEEFQIEALSAQWVLPTRYRAVFDTTPQNGTSPNNSLPSYCAVCVSKLGILADAKSQGRTYFPGIPVNGEDNSGIEDTYRAGWDNYIPSFLTPLDVGLGPDDLIMTIATPDSADPLLALYTVDDVRLNSVLRAQRRREVGVGE